MGGKQVAVLAPTTLLVEQHAQNFADRFADFPVKVASLSRFNNSKATKAALEGMADGTVDIVIGTHKLVQDDIKFKNLGLVIIDEEHRFGVRQKEQLKRLRANVDILTMTATPIPRTLSMALEGLRDFSLITTAPSRRLAVKTFVKPFSEGSVREAVLRELKRGGQVFFLHNEVDTIENMRERLETLLPEARIGVAHGQLRERELEQVMRDFCSKDLTCCSVPPSSKPASTSPTPTPSSSTAPTNSGWRNCTSFAGASAAATTKPTPTCLRPNTSPKTQKNASTPLRRQTNSVQASPSPCRIWKSAAQAKSSAKGSPAK